MATSAQSVSILQILSCLLLAHAVSSIECHLPNGEVATSVSHKPCTDDLSHPLSTLCCAEGDYCRKEGICQHSGDENTINWYRGTCTESEWRSGKCREVCDKESLRDAAQAPMYLCGPDSTVNLTRYCCGSQWLCCDQSSVLPILLGDWEWWRPSTKASSSKAIFSTSVTTSTAYKSSTTTSNSTTSTTLQPSPSEPTTLPSATNGNNDTSQTNTNKKPFPFEIAVGVALGSFFFLALIIAVCVYIKQNQAENIHIGKSKAQKKRRSKQPELVPPVQEAVKEERKDEELPEWTSQGQRG